MTVESHSISIPKQLCVVLLFISQQNDCQLPTCWNYMGDSDKYIVPWTERCWSDEKAAHEKEEKKKPEEATLMQ